MTTPPLIAALTGQRGPTPVWFMRQAGRSLPEYRELRADIGLPMLEACLRPDVAAEATVQPVRRHGVDAGIFFSDIMVPLRLAGWVSRLSRVSARSSTILIARARASTNY